jgi:hypothetical protein
MIKSIQTKFNKRQTLKENQNETGSLKILTDEVLYVTYAGTHTYTFKVVRKNPIYLLENIVLHYNLRTKSYDEYLMQYKDVKEQDLKEIAAGKLFQDSKKVIVTKLENGFFESDSASNKGNSTSRASDFICNTETTTLAISCSEEVHNAGNMGEWHNCTAATRPHTYQSSYTTCLPTYTSAPIPQETADPSSSGNGNDPDVVIYNPLPLEPCDNTAEVDLNGNCIQPIDVAVSYIANCLSGNYSTILSQNEINFLYSTTSSFEIKSYLENNGCSSESSSFAKEMINQMRQAPGATWAQFENWFMGTSEGIDGDYDASFWEDPNLTFQQQNLPTLSKFLNAYPKNLDGKTYMLGKDLYPLVGDEVYQAYLDYPHLVNGSCALKVSRALNYSDIIIPKTPNTLKGKDGKYYFVNAKALNKWMRLTFGTDKNNPNYRNFTKNQGGNRGENFPNLVKGLKGIYSMVSPLEIKDSWASGHADLIFDQICPFKCHFYDEKLQIVPIEYIDIWILN